MPNLELLLGHFCLENTNISQSVPVCTSIKVYFPKLSDVLAFLQNLKLPAHIHF